HGDVIRRDLIGPIRKISRNDPFGAKRFGAALWPIANLDEEAGIRPEEPTIKRCTTRVQRRPTFQRPSRQRDGEMFYTGIGQSRRLRKWLSKDWCIVAKRRKGEAMLANLLSAIGG